MENIKDLAKEGMQKFPERDIDVISLDLDGNDIFFVEELLKNKFTPKLFIVEYNGKFPPPVKFQIEYDPFHQWDGGDYFGASLSSYVEIFQIFGYRLICCNSHTGANAFFIRRDCDKNFADVPTDVQDIYVSPRYHLYSKFGHPPSKKVIEKIFKE